MKLFAGYKTGKIERNKHDGKGKRMRTQQMNEITRKGEERERDTTARGTREKTKSKKREWG